MIKEAFFDEQREYRYSIKRTWDKNKKRVVFICLNPSTADEYEDDQTLSRCIDFSKRWENGSFGSLEEVNLFAIRATDPQVMKVAKNPVGKDNDEYILNAVKNADIIIATWGEHGSFRRRDREVLTLIKSLSREIHCLEVLKCKQPKHPSRAKKALEPTSYIY
ncbi:hypothetical protein CN481_15745 [Bacillus sp. AFS006103]|nr:hypothetical protein CN481_15745 [Bacillus sp. AFS006103]